MPVFVLSVCAAALAAGCTLQEIAQVGDECPPTVSSGGDFLRFGNIQCYAGKAIGPDLGENGECISEQDADCAQNLKQCKRYQKDFDALAANTQSQKLTSISILVDLAGNPVPYDAAEYGGVNNACPTQFPSCAWTTIQTKDSSEITQFGCIQCALNQSICGFECVDTKIDKLHCGQCGNVCPNNSDCIDGECAIKGDCGENEFIDKNGNCAEYSLSRCGIDDAGEEINCSSATGFKSGICDLKLKKCIAYACYVGFRIDSATNLCAADSNDCCGTACDACDAAGGELCSNGVCADNCADGLIKCVNSETGKAECANLDSSSAHCGACNEPCAPNPDQTEIGVLCQNGACVATRCAQGAHFNDAGRCEPDSADNCGSIGHACDVANAENSCNAGICAFSCNAGFHEYNSACEPDSADNCGAHDAACNVANAENSCNAGVCAFSCNASYHEYDNACEADDINNCGAHDAPCIITNGAGQCADAVCKVASCDSGYHEYDNACEADSIDNCGSHGNACDPVANGSVSCTNGACKIACDSGYHEYDNACELNTVFNCGSHGNACDPVANGSVSCTNGACKIACDSGYHEYDNACELNTVFNCGSHGNACDPVANGSVSCTNGACKITCDNGYLLFQNHCNSAPVLKNNCPVSSYIDCNGDGSKCCVQLSDCTASIPTKICLATAVD